MRWSMSTGAEALLVPDTSMPTLDLGARLEAATGQTVLTTNAVSLRDAMCLGGCHLPTRGYGHLLEEMPDPSPGRSGR